MEPRPGLVDVAERGHLEDVAVALLPRDLEASGILGRIGLYRTELLVAASADRRPVVTGDAARVHEGREARHLGVVERRVLSVEERVETRRGDEAPLEGADRPGHVVVADRVVLVREGRGEGRRVVGDGAQHHHHSLFAGHGHLDRVEHGALRLLLDVGGAPVPELGQVEGRVVDGGRVAFAPLTLVTGRRGLAVHPVAREVVAAVAADVLVLGEARVEVEQAAERDLCLGHRVALARRLVGKLAEDRARPFSNRRAVGTRGLRLRCLGGGCGRGRCRGSGRVAARQQRRPRSE